MTASNEGERETRGKNLEDKRSLEIYRHRAIDYDTESTRQTEETRVREERQSE